MTDKERMLKAENDARNACFEAIKNKGLIDYVAMMAYVDLPDEDETPEEPTGEEVDE